MGTDATSVIHRYAIQHYGNLISVGKPEFDPVDKIWIAELQSDYPRIIHDDRLPNERILRFLSLNRLGTIKVKENLETIEATPRETCIDNISNLLNIWNDRAEKIIIKASADNLSNINEARWILSKIGTIISRIKWENVILDSEIDALHPKEATKYRKYLRLLESLDIIKHIENCYSYGPMFTVLSEGVHNDYTKLSTAILSHIIKERYSSLRDIFGISQLEPFIHIDACYYRPALEAERIIYWGSDSFTKRCANLYGNTSKVYFRLPYILEELVTVKALCYEDKLYFANKDLFKEMISLRSEMTEIGCPRA